MINAKTPNVNESQEFNLLASAIVLLMFLYLCVHLFGLAAVLQGGACVLVLAGGYFYEKFKAMRKTIATLQTRLAAAATDPVVLSDELLSEIAAVSAEDGVTYQQMTTKLLSSALASRAAMKSA